MPAGFQRTAGELALPLAVALLASGCAHAGRGGRAGATIRVSGEGRVQAKPDLATVSLGVEALAKQLPAAVADADARMRAVLAAVGGAGIAEKDVRTVRYDVVLERRYDQGAPSEPVGYRVVHELRVVVRGADLARAGGAVDAALRAGANVVHSIAFEREDPSPERARALEAAVAAARGKAEALARASGRTLGEVRAVVENAAGPVVPLMRAESFAAKASGAPVQAGELEITAQVEVEFALR